MRELWKSSLATACLVAAACGGSDGMRERQPIQDQTPSAPQEMTLTGCVRSGQLETAFVLEDVRMGSEAPSSQRQQEGGSHGGSALPSNAITEGSIVQLAANDPALLRQHVGQEVRVRGTLTDSGTSTIGTSGARGDYTTPSGDRSAASQTDKSYAEKKQAEAGPIARESMANGTAPTLRLSSVEATGQPCQSRQQGGR